MYRPKGGKKSGSYGKKNAPMPGWLKKHKSSKWTLLTVKSRRSVRPTFRSKWGRWWFYHPRSKKVAVSGGILTVVLVGFVVGRLWLAASRIIDDGNTAVALSQDVDPSLLNHEGDGRINLLMIGVGGEGHQAGDLSDSILIASLDPATKHLGFVSLPRDLYVPIEGYGSAKINAAHAYGEQYDYPGGGPKLLADTITGVFNIPIHYYFRADFKGFREAIDAVGGVDVVVKKAINDAAYPDENLSGYEPFQLKAGPHHLDSELALKYVRSRYGSSDFDRADRQQSLLLALKDKVLSAGTLLDPIKINRLISIAAGHVRTNLNVEDGLKMMDLVGQVDKTQITKINLDSSEGNLLVSRVIDGAWVLAPAAGNWDEVNRYLRRQLPDGYIKREAAQINIVNASGRDGLAKQVSSLLKSYGYRVSGISTQTGSPQDKTTVIDYSQNSKPYTLNYLKKRFKLANIESSAKSAGQTYDITIILGNDYELTTS